MCVSELKNFLLLRNFSREEQDYCSIFSRISLLPAASESVATMSFCYTSLTAAQDLSGFWDFLLVVLTFSQIESIFKANDFCRPRLLSTDAATTTVCASGVSS